MQANSSGTSDIVELTRDGIKSCLNICWSNCRFFCLKEGSVLSNVWLHVVTKLLIPYLCSKWYSHYTFPCYLGCTHLQLLPIHQIR